MKYFGTDGIRGIVNDDLTIELIQKIGKTLKVLKVDKIYVGYDSRLSNYLVLTSLVSGILATGIEVINLGMVSTPLLQYLSRKYNLITLMITASHNPYYYNGIKIFRNGDKLNEEEELLIENSIDKEIVLKTGTYQIDASLKNNYLNYLKEFKVQNSKRIILDLANGAVVNIAKDLFKQEDNILLINDKPNGRNINLECGSLFIDKVKLNDYDYLFSFDGDGDRVLFKDKDRVYDGDLIVYILAKYYKLDKVVLTKNVNLGLLKAFKKSKIKVYYSEVGDKNVYDLMIKENCILGGESSGHIINLKYMTSGDGLLNSLIIIKILNEIDLNDYLKDVEYYPQLKLNLSNDYSMDKLENIQKKYNKKARINLRRSGTEKVIRVDISSKNATIIEKIKEEIMNNE